MQQWRHRPSLVVPEKTLVSHACYPLFKDQNATNNGCAMASRSDGRGKRHATKPCPNSIEKSNRIYQCSPPYRVSSEETEIMKEIIQNGPVQ
ncbi:Tubulointerstitial nephritis antigen, partial [Camelus dromedarius]